MPLLPFCASLPVATAVIERVATIGCVRNRASRIGQRAGVLPNRGWETRGTGAASARAGIRTSPARGATPGALDDTTRRAAGFADLHKAQPSPLVLRSRSPGPTRHAQARTRSTRLVAL